MRSSLSRSSILGPHRVPAFTAARAVRRARRLAVALLSFMTVLIPHPHSALGAGPPAQPNAAQIELALRKLGVVGSVLYVAAHPDDENTSLLAYLSNQALLRTAYLSLTRGDGGQNLVGAEQGAALGLIRTQELLAARRIDGAEQFFTRARDFGYSKTPEETLRIWGHDAVLADVVRVIRRFRPDVIITRFSPLPSDTHGHHTASAMLAVEAFRAAADPAFHPEQLAGGVTAWQARRLLWNRSTFNLKPEDDLSGMGKLDVGGYNPLLGLSYGEMAADSRSMHKSQGFGVARARGPIVEYFKLLEEAGAAKPAARTGAGAAAPSKASVAPGMPGLLGGLDVSWARFKGAAALRSLTERAARQFSPGAPHTVLPLLLQIDAALDAVPDAGWRAQKKKELRELVLACAGLFVEATAADFRVAPGAEIEITAVALDRSPAPLTLRAVHFPGTGPGELSVGRQLAAAGGAGAFEIKRAIRLAADTPLTTPYWLDAPSEPGLFHVADATLIGDPESPPPLRVDFVFEAGRRAFTVTRPIAYKWTDPVAGERYRPLEVVPLVSVRPDTSVLLFTDKRAQLLSVRLGAGAAGLSGLLRPELPPGWTSEPVTARFALAGKGDELDVKFRIQPPAAAAAAGTLRVVAEIGAAKLARGVSHIEHPHIPIQTVLTEAEVRLVPLALRTAGTKIGYLPGPGDEVPGSLRRVGYDVTMISDETLAAGAAALAHFDAIVVGVRAFNTNDHLRAAHAALMSYVEAGGTLVVQYNTNSRLGPLSGPIGPFALEIGHDRVTDESAAVTFLAPAHPALNTPNQITARDFDGWIQERGLYFATSWDPRYQTVIAMNDPSERPSAGSLLWARHGRGTFIYTGLAFFRQLPAGVPGAFRLFANLMAGGAHAR
jgi:LmbE family N-acetylglucosaminyl deacetylase